MNNCFVPRFFYISACKIVFIFFAVFVLLASTSFKLHAQGNLMITPRRVVFDGNKKIAELNVANIGNDTMKYTISMIEIKMKANGTFENITVPDSGQNFASPYLRFFPRSVVLAPNEVQSVRVQVINSSGLQQGEYRSHIYFRAVPDDGPISSATYTKDSTISVHLTPVFGITIPVIIREGSSDAEVNISNLSIDGENDSTTVVDMIFNRTGNMSVYGNLKVELISPQGTVKEVGVANGIAVYTPTSSRQFKIALPKKSTDEYHAGKLHVIYTGAQDSKDSTLAEAEIALH